VAVDPASDVRDPPGAALSALVAAQVQLQAAEPETLDAAPAAAGWRARAEPSRAMSLN
jgi:hypothetical protein